MSIIHLNHMIQEIITYSIIVVATSIFAYNIYKKFFGKPASTDKCGGCCGCDNSTPKGAKAGIKCRTEAENTMLNRKIDGNIKKDRE